MGLDVEYGSAENLEVYVWDLSVGESKDMMERYCQNITDVIFVVDSTDVHNISYANYVLWEFLAAFISPNANLLVIANKQDDPNTISVPEIEQEFGLRYYQKRKCAIQGACARTGEGIEEALNTLINLEC